MSRATETLIALAEFNSWRRGDDSIEQRSHSEVGSLIDQAVNLLREHDRIETEYRRLYEAVDSIAYQSRNRIATRISLRNRIAETLSQFSRP